MKFNDPIVTPVTNAATGRKIANKGPNNEYEARIESTPVVGVETKKLKVALLLAPSFCNDAATGITPQEQMGNGIPKSEALIIVTRLFLPKCLVIKSVPINTCRIPAKNIPNNKYGAIAVIIFIGLINFKHEKVTMKNEFIVEDMTCKHCKMTIENKLNSLEGVTKVLVNIDEKTVGVDGDVSIDKIEQAIRAAGYSPERK